MTSPLWQPTAQALASTNLKSFIDQVSERVEPDVVDYDRLFAWSIGQPGEFWSAVWDWAAVKGEKGSGPFLVDGDRMPGARFFPAASLNYAENLLVRGDDADALVFWGEDKVKRRMSWRSLNALSARFQAMLDDVGVKTGDRVAAMLPNMPETIAAALGTSAGGAVWSSCSPDFGVQGVLDRFGQIEPVVLVACDGYYYNGKPIRIAAKVREIAAKLPSVKRIVVVDYLGEAGDVAGSIEKAESWESCVASRVEQVPRFTRLPFAHPLFILFSSGTTGVPKCIVHSAGGTLLKHICEQRFHTDLRPLDRLFYFSTCGWMMWNWLVSGLSSGATLLLYDGSPFHPSGNILFEYADAEAMTVFGTSAKYIDALSKAGLKPRESHKLSTVRTMLSTGSPLAAESFDYVYRDVKKDIHLASISGGTDIIGCFVTGNPMKPVWRGEIQGSGLGMATDVVDENGKPVRHGKGELVCLKPFPSMPVGFWNDPAGKRYFHAYFARFPNIWHHGDFAEWTEHGGMIIHGRSDATLNPGGVRIGTAEIYRQVEQLPEIKESIVIGQDWESDVRVVLFVVLQPGMKLDDGLKDRIKRKIRDGASPRHVPAKIVAVADIPRTKSGKITELAVRDIIMGREVKNKEALANPEALELYRSLPELGS